MRVQVLVKFIAVIGMMAWVFFSGPSQQPTIVLAAQSDHAGVDQAVSKPAEAQETKTDEIKAHDVVFAGVKQTKNGVLSIPKGNLSFLRNAKKLEHSRRGSLQ